MASWLLILINAMGHRNSRETEILISDRKKLGIVHVHLLAPLYKTQRFKGYTAL
jgi:hypothetical protein